MSFNEKLSYTEHVVTTPTTDFAIGFADYGLPSDTINVFVDDVLATEAGYTVTRKNNMVVELQPAVSAGVVRLQRATNLDASFYRFTAGAKFVAANIDANFNQILHSQQETRDGFNKLASDVYPLVDGLEDALEKADAASKAAQEAAEAAEEASQATRSASQVTDKSGLTQQEVNDQQLVINTGVNELLHNILDYKVEGDVNFTEAFQRAASAIASKGKGVLYIPYNNGIPYIIGKQSWVSGQAVKFERVFTIDETVNVSSILIKSDNAVLKWADGLKFGAFDPVTGSPIANGGVDQNKAAGIGYAFNLIGCKTVAVVGSLEIDGNDVNMIKGGLFGDRGTQCTHYGFRCIYSDSIYIENLYTHHHCLDGLYLGGKRYETIDDMYKRGSSRTYNNIRSLYNGRNNLTIAGGMNHNFFGGSFSYAGKSVFRSNPASGCDAEAEQGMIRNVNFYGTHFIDNDGSQFVADSGDSAGITFYNAIIIGGSGSLWINKPYVSFIGGIISCYIEKTYNSDVGRTVFDNVRITDDPLVNPYAANYTVNNMIYPYNSVFNRCTIDLYKWGVQSTSGFESYIDSSITVNGSWNGIIGSFLGTTKNLVFIDNRTVKSAKTIQITTGKHSGMLIKSTDTSISGLQFSAQYETDMFPKDQSPYKLTASKFNYEEVRRGFTLTKTINVSNPDNTLTLSAANAAPTDLTFYGKGSRIFNYDWNGSTGTKEWLCTKGGIAIADSQVWVASTPVSYPAYRLYGDNVYLCTASGTTGTTPPTHTSGTVSDGNVSWKYLNTRATFIGLS